MTPFERVTAALEFQEPDRVPFFLLLSMHGAKELGLSIQTYFSKPEYVIEGQLRMQVKYQHDCLYPFFYAPVEVEAWGGEVLYSENGPPNSGRPIIQSHEEIAGLAPPRVEDCPSLVKVLKAIRGLKQKAGNRIPIIGVVMSPFSLPVMQMGFEPYLQLLYEHPEKFAKLMKINEAFCTQWANAQLAAGATAICYFDPVSSPTIIPRKMYLNTGHPVAKRTMQAIEGPTATHMASGRCLPIIDDILATGTGMICASAEENLTDIKNAVAGKLPIIGNLNGVEMRRWSPGEAENEVRQAIAKAGAGGGFILADNHGEIPFQVTEEVLLSFSEAVHKWGRYPLKQNLSEIENRT